MDFILAAVQQLGPYFAQSGRIVAVQRTPVPGHKPAGTMSKTLRVVQPLYIHTVI